MIGLLLENMNLCDIIYLGGYMQINSKLESIEYIKDKKLKQFPEQLFHSGDDKKIIDFLNNHPAKYYAIRSKEKVKCLNNDYKVAMEDVLQKTKQFDLFTINVSSYNYIDNLILIGDIMIGSNNNVWVIASTNKNYTGRMAEQNPDFNISTDIFDNKLNEIPGFDLIYKYIVENNLIDIIVELAVYDIPVGVNKSNIVIFEVRTSF